MCICRSLDEPRHAPAAASELSLVGHASGGHCLQMSIWLLFAPMLLPHRQLALFPSLGIQLVTCACAGLASRAVGEPCQHLQQHPSWWATQVDCTASRCPCGGPVHLRCNRTGSLLIRPAQASKQRCVPVQAWTAGPWMSPVSACSSIRAGLGGPYKWRALPSNVHMAPLCTDDATTQSACSLPHLPHPSINMCMCRSGKQNSGRSMPVPGPASKLGLVGHAGGGHEATHAAGPLCISAAPPALPG